MAGNKMQARIIIGLALILFGVLFLLNNYDIYFFPFEVITWEYFFIFFGAVIFALSQNKTVGVILIAVGLFNLVPELWPLIFVGIGAMLIFRRGSHRFGKFKIHTSVQNDSEGISDKDIIEEVNVFGGNAKVMNTENFKGGSVVSLFGGSEVNLTNCKLAQGENVLDVTFIFGGSTLIVPANWRIETDVLSVFGGFGDKRRKDPNMVYEEGKTLLVKGFVLFGGGEIKN